MQHADTTFDLIGLGFGPANIAIGGALVEGWNSCRQDYPIKKVLFVEKHAKFQWHPGMLLPGARMQISFMKDLATLRSPQSPITFLSYLHSQNRLINFINRGSTIPTRKEYADYLSWAAHYVQDHGVSVLFGTEVVGVDSASDGLLVVHAKNVASGEVTSYTTRNLIISPGGTGRVPVPLVPLIEHPLVIHSSTYLMSVDSIIASIAAKGKGSLRVAVIGAGQSAAEVTLNLRERLTSIPAPAGRHQIDMIIRKGALRPSDDTPFANEIFDPQATDAWFSHPSNASRTTQLQEFKSTNYSVINSLTLEALYEVIYGQKVDGDIARRTNGPTSSIPLIHIRPYSCIVAAHAPEDNGDPDFTFTIQHVLSCELETEKYDAIICATGYQRTSWIDLLKNSSVGKHFGLSPACQPGTCQPHSGHKEVGSPSSSNGSAVSTPPTSPALSVAELEHHGDHKVYISRGYCLVPTDDGGLKSRIYLQGVEEATHGLSDSLLSVLGVRAGEVIDDLCKEA
ncbi:L-lysine 6-monooxygenase (NADPH-requiring)-domain-containing protein [Desarmillaria tabescens]|uniref:L-ornithine N(5)-monooxygenase [NAD(P)H] n=1 Tax=Armillaria tabescens TaxID=1929756 RepID=A0AA39NE17_ARMTA|nr:L-lysine 6-monooxygenase (NADPH-requiring)-domain-containing protein [Desarmillaria tabescens]KAK0463938.1 L-lysine 6-monooxygenase (NADPH-requiring)-domain-containing protein [Desarmillaria tabescens]